MTSSVTSITSIRTAARRRTEARAATNRLIVLLLVVVGILIVVGLGGTLSSSSVPAFRATGDRFVFFKRHAAWVGGGILVLIVAARVHYSWYRRLAAPIFLVSTLGLLAVPFIGTELYGATRWIEFGGISVQPSEFAKFAVIAALAAVYAKKEKLLGEFGHFVAPLAAVVGLTALLIMAQPDLGTTVVVVSAGFAVAVASAAPLRHSLLVTVAGAALAIMAAMASPYRWARVTAFLDPWADQLGSGQQAIQSYLALGSGGLFGVGLGASRARWSYLPNAHTDFVFAILGEETGFAGGAMILLLFGVFVVVGLAIAMRAHDRFGRLLAVGIVAWITVQGLINIGGVVGALPITGIPLPFVSMGGSALLTVMGATGILLNIARNGKPLKKKR